MNTNGHKDAERIPVGVPVADAGIPLWSEVLSALPDPADPDQAMLANVPFLNDGLNFGDLVRLGEPDELGIRPVVEVVLASGHVHMIAATEPNEARELADEIQRHFPSYALRIEAAHGHLLAVSAHPDLDPAALAEVIEAWLAAEAEDDEEGVALGRACSTRLGPLRAAADLSRL